jgi:hypothetical protein
LRLLLLPTCRCSCCWNSPHVAMVVVVCLVRWRLVVTLLTVSCEDNRNSKTSYASIQGTYFTLAIHLLRRSTQRRHLAVMVSKPNPQAPSTCIKTKPLSHLIIYSPHSVLHQ